jgi:hypothetical protein
VNAVQLPELGTAVADLGSPEYGTEFSMTTAQRRVAPHREAGDRMGGGGTAEGAREAARGGGEGGSGRGRRR